MKVEQWPTFQRYVLKSFGTSYLKHFLNFCLSFSWLKNDSIGYLSFKIACENKSLPTFFLCLMISDSFLISLFEVSTLPDCYYQRKRKRCKSCLQELFFRPNMVRICF